jgi:hypothetical protein
MEEVERMVAESKRNAPPNIEDAPFRVPTRVRTDGGR